MQRVALLTSSTQYDKILGQQQLVMVNYACGFNQSERGKYFELTIIILTIHSKYLQKCSDEQKLFPTELK